MGCAHMCATLHEVCMACHAMPSRLILGFVANAIACNVRIGRAEFTQALQVGEASRSAAEGEIEVPRCESAMLAFGEIVEVFLHV